MRPPLSPPAVSLTAPAAEAALPAGVASVEGALVFGAVPVPKTFSAPAKAAPKPAAAPSFGGAKKAELKLKARLLRSSAGAESRKARLTHALPTHVTIAARQGADHQGRYQGALSCSFHPLALL
jgi:hypothetical protein